MKPERGSLEADDMEEIEKDPLEMLQDLGMMVLEARTPDSSAKGRIEGPHCPLSRHTQAHMCSKESLECRRAYDLHKQMDKLWRNNIPACIDVLLYPDCEHGRREAEVLEGASHSTGETAAMDNCILLERWIFKLYQKRHVDSSHHRVVGPSMLLQAIKSYLHFSQLSSWLLSSGGCLPLTIVYRLYAPGENVGYDFLATPDQHSFPQTDLTYFGVKVHVSALPRQGRVELQCLQMAEQNGIGSSSVPSKNAERKKGMLDKQTDWFSAQAIRKIDRDEGTESRQNERGRPLKRTRHHQSEIARKRGSRRIPEGNPSEARQENRQDHSSHKPSPVLEPLSSTPTPCDLRFSTYRDTENKDDCQEKTPCNSYNERSSNSLKAVDQQEVPYGPESATRRAGCYSDDSRRGIPPEQSDFRESYPQKFQSPSRQRFKEKLLPLKPDISSSGCKLQVDTTATTSKCLHSPKVLMTCNTKPQQAFTKRKYLDLTDSSGSDEWETQYLSSRVKDLASPLSPTDIQNYLANLKTVTYPRSQILDSSLEAEVCVTPKCKFYIGSEFEKSFDNGYQSEDRPSSRLKNENMSRTKLDSSHYHTDLSRALTERYPNDLDSVTCKLQELSPFSQSESPPAKKERTENTHQLPETDVDVSETKQQAKHVKCASPTKVRKRKFPEGNCANDSSLEDSGLEPNFANGHSLEDSGLEPSDCSVANGHSSVSSETRLNFPPADNESPSLLRTAQDLPLRVNQSEESLCNNCDIPIHKRLSHLRKIPTTPTLEDEVSFQRHMTKSASMMFSSRTGLPTQSSPAPIKRKSLGRFDYDSTLTSARAIKNAISCSKLALHCDKEGPEQAATDSTGRVLSTSAPASTNCLLGNFEESVLNGRIEPIGAVDGFTAEIGASGSFCPKHITLPVTAYFFKLSDDNAPSPYLGHIDLETLNKRGYHIPKKGTVQVTLFNPNKTVVKMFVVMYDLRDMPANCQTFLRQRTLYMPVDPDSNEPAFLRYLIHLRFASSKSGKIHLHTDIRLIFARDKFEFDTKVAQYELRSFNEGPVNPKFSPKR